MGRPALALGLLATALVGSMGAGCGSSANGASGQDAGTSSGSGSGSGSGSSSGGDAGGSSSGSSTYPAFPPEMPVLQNAKVDVMTAPKLVTVTWATDTNQSALQDFGAKLGPSSYWKTVMADYGIGPTTSANVVVTTAPPATWAAADIDTWVQQQVSNLATSGWPAPDAQTIYMVYVPSDVAVTDLDPTTNQPIDACGLEAGYHSQLILGTNQDAATYGIALEHCSVESQTNVLDDATSTAAHEIGEAATDPYSDAQGNASGWYGFDADHLAWSLWNQWQLEMGDACQYFDENSYKEGADLPYMVQRLWSNTSAKAGHDPCVPVPAGPYNNVTPLGLESVSVTAVDINGTLSPFTTKGWRVTPGQTVKVKVGFYSDAPMAAWSVKAAETAYTGSSSFKPVLGVSPATFTGQNGDTVELSLTVSGAPAQGTTALLQLSSDAGGGVNHYMPVVVGVY